MVAIANRTDAVRRETVSSRSVVAVTPSRLLVR
jgi:hypothetical protein